MSSEFPKWVTPHASHIVRLPDGRPIAPLWHEFNVERDGTLKIIVKSPEEEAEALAEVPTEGEPKIPTEAEYETHLWGSAQGGSH